MKIHNKLDELLSQGSKVKILRFLSGEKDEHTGRGIAKAAKMSASFTYATLQEMKNEGLVEARKKGNSILYKLKGNNYFIKKLLLPLFEREKAVYADVISYIKKVFFRYKSEIVSMAIFGSVSRREESYKSDIDLLIILKDEHGRKKIDKVIDKLGTDLIEEFGIYASPYVLTKGEIRKKYMKKQFLIISILDDNKLIFGEPIERILA